MNLDEPLQSRSFELLASVKLGNGNTFEFYEAEPGAILVSETGPLDNTTTLTEGQILGHSIADLYRGLSGKRELPTKLASAVKRRMKLRRTLGLSGDPADGPHLTSRVGRAELALSTRQGGYGCQGANTIASTWEGTGTGIIGTRRMYWYHMRDDVNYYAGMVCNFPGQVPSITMSAQYRRWWSWKTYGSWAVNSGYWRYWTHYDGSYDFDAQTAIFNWGTNTMNVYDTGW